MANNSLPVQTGPLRTVPELGLIALDLPLHHGACHPRTVLLALPSAPDFSDGLLAPRLAGNPVGDLLQVGADLLDQAVVSIRWT
ncbi:MAG: hypothetical protein SV775_05810 [Thermodesulfobacteriota bacterium]|nr:hypothetical protein [Thermodesulfobacteriota bacterium]